MLNSTLKCIKLLTGLAVLLLGIVLALPFIPGPGIPIIILGLVILSDHFTWAKRTLHWIKEKWHYLHWKHEWPRGCPGNSERTPPSENAIGGANIRN